MVDEAHEQIHVDASPARCFERASAFAEYPDWTNDVKQATVLEPRTVRFEFKRANAELPLMVGGLPVFPAAGYVEVLMAAAREVHGDGALELREMDIVRPLVFDGDTTFETLVRLTAETGIVEFLSRPRGGGGDWALNARGIVSRSPVSERKGSAES